MPTGLLLLQVDNLAAVPTEYKKGSIHLIAHALVIVEIDKTSGAHEESQMTAKHDEAGRINLSGDIDRHYIFSTKGGIPIQ